MRVPIPKTSTIFMLMLSFTGAFLCLFLWEIVRKPSAYFGFEKLTPADLSRGHAREQKQVRDVMKLEKVIIHDYTEWHRETVAKVKTGLLDPSSVRTLVFLGNNGTHGLGDRMRGIIFSYMMAVISERLLLIDWRYPFPLSDLFAPGMGSNFTHDPQMFSPVAASGGTGGSREYIFTEQFKVDLFATATQEITFMSEPRPNFNKFLKAIRTQTDLPAARRLNRTLISVSTAVKAPTMFPLILKALFRPSSSLRKMISEPIGKHNRYSVSRIWQKGPLRRINTAHPYISVHVRLGEGVGEAETRFDIRSMGMSHLDLAECVADDAIDLAQELRLPPPYRFYIATDTIEFRRIFRRTIARKKKNAKVMFGSWGVKHVREMKKGVLGDLRKYMFTFADLYLLSEGRGMVAGSSGFANLATWMGGIKARKIFKFYECKSRERNRS